MSPQDRVLVLSVHPDDESIATGGLIQSALARGAEVRVVFVTDGEDNPWAQRYVERRWRITKKDRVRWGHRRRREAIDALSCLGLTEDNAEFWGFPDQGITSLLAAGGGRLLTRIADVVRTWNPSLVVAPSIDDVHPDHNSMSMLVELGLADIAPNRRPSTLYYLVHPGPFRGVSSTRHIDLSPDEVDRKRNAILAHRTQMALSRRRFTAFAEHFEEFQDRLDSSFKTSSATHLKVTIMDESIVVAGDFVRRPCRLWITSRSGGEAVSREVKVPLLGRPELSDGNARKILDETLTITGRALVLSAAPFSNARSLAVKRIDGFGIFDKTGWLLGEGSPQSLSQKQRAILRPRICSVIPCFNIAEVCESVVDGASQYSDLVIAIDDGSSDGTGLRLERAAARHPSNLRVIRFEQNMGKGVVMIAAFRKVLEEFEFDVLVTLDGDGQHRPSDIPRLAQELVRGGFSMVIGERLSRGSMPLRSRFGNTLTAFIMRAFHPNAPTDTQSGFRAFSPRLARAVVEDIKGGRYETELKILLLALARRYRIGSVTIPTVYIDGNRLSHFRPFVDSLKIYRTLVSWRDKAPSERHHFPWPVPPA